MNAAFWGNGMSSNGFHAAPDEMQEAFAAWRMSLGYLDLAYRLEQVQPMFGQTELGSRAASRIADRMCQKMRKAGMIEPVASGRQGWRRINQQRSQE